VKTILGSGNVIFRNALQVGSSARAQIEAAMQKDLGRVFATTVRSIDELAALVASDPYKAFKLAPSSKRIVTLLHSKPTGAGETSHRAGWRAPSVHQGTEILGAYVRSENGPVFMRLIEKTFGKDLTTRTWDTLGKW